MAVANELSAIPFGALIGGPMTGAAASYQVEVRLLSLLPIPALQIKEAELEFFVKIVDMVAQDQTTRSSQTSNGAEVETPGARGLSCPAQKGLI